MRSVQGTATDKTQPRARSVPRWLWLLAMLAAVLMTVQAVQYIYGAGGWATYGALGLNGQADCDAGHFCTVTRVVADKPAARAGIVIGDAVRLDDRWAPSRQKAVGEHVGMTVRHRGTERHLDLVAAPYQFHAPTYVLDGVVDIVICLLALLLIARAGRGWAGLLLGLALVCHGQPGNYPRLWENAPSLYVPSLVVLTAIDAAMPSVVFLALRSFRRDVTGASPRWLDLLAALFAVLGATALVVGDAAYLRASPVLGLANGLDLISLVNSAGAILAPLALATGWRAVPGASRTRYAFMIAAVSAFSLKAAIDPLIMLNGNDYVTLSVPVVTQMGAQILGAILFTYALLRHRVIDLGFAINRTLVFSSLSFILLLAFGLVEWGTEKLLPVESHEASVVIDAAIALALFLAFHRVHAWVEGVVERVFFHHWHANEARLHEFLRQAAYITSADVLTTRAVEALQRFSGGAEVALYRIDASEPLLAAGGITGLPARLDPDDPLLVALRADRAAVRDAHASGGLALPMVHRAEVTGLVVLSAKPGGDGYRPDEEAQLAEAVRRIGLDLYALRVDELERANARLAARLLPPVHGAASVAFAT